MLLPYDEMNEMRSARGVFDIEWGKCGADTIVSGPEGSERNRSGFRLAVTIMEGSEK